MENYAEAKRQIVAHQGAGDAKILNAADPVVRGFRDASASDTYEFTLKTLAGDRTMYVDQRTLIRMAKPVQAGPVDVSRRKMPGTFNLENMLAAATATWVVDRGVWTGWAGACEDVFNTFPGVEHRLEFVAEKGGVKYYNDSKATDAEATIAALDTLPGPFVLILGGFDKKTPWDALARAVAEKPVRAVVLLGQTAPAIEAAIRASGRVPEIVRVGSIDEAARVPARTGETVLLSPACASWDMFRNFTERGLRFKALVAALPDR
jgi:UDP-N-acetylmuramoylalanine--D-glutamate ligase